MKTAIRAIAIAVALGWGTAAFAQENVKIGIVDLEAALAKTSEGKAARDELERKQKEAQSQLQPMADNLKSMEAEFESKKFVLSEEALAQKRLDYASKRNELETKLRELDGKFKVDAERMFGPLQKRLIDAVQDVGKEQGFTMIFARGAGGMIYSREALDITDLVVQKFNQKG